MANSPPIRPPKAVLGYRHPLVPSVSDPAQDVFNRDVAAHIRATGAQPWSTGTLHENVAVSTTELKLAHGLDKVPQGYLALGKTGPGDFWMSAEPDKTYLYLLADASFTVDLWVF